MFLIIGLLLRDGLLRMSRYECYVRAASLVVSETILHTNANPGDSALGACDASGLVTNMSSNMSEAAPAAGPRPAVACRATSARAPKTE